MFDIIYNTKTAFTFLYNQVHQVVPGTVKRLVRRVGTNGEVHETPILTTYRRIHNQEDFEDLDDEYPGSLLVIPIYSLNSCLLVEPLAFF